MSRLGLYIHSLLLCTLLLGCMEWEYGYTEEFDTSDHQRGLFIVCEGNFQYGNSTLSYYNPDTREVQNEVFYRANAMKLGDVAQSMTIHNGKGWITVNNSHVAFAIDTDTFREVGRIENLTSPRYIHFLSDTKAYITQIWDNRIFVVDPSRYQIIGHIECPEMSMESGSTEQMVQWGQYLFVNCWSYQDRILKIDTTTDQVVGELKVGIQPTSIVIDKNQKLWVLTDGGYGYSPYGQEAPALYRIDAQNFQIERVFRFEVGDRSSEVHINAAGDRLYWINNDVWQMDVEADQLPVVPLLPYNGTIYYGLTVCPHSGEVYIADAIDHQQAGKIYRLDRSGEIIDEFYVGVAPGAFCWK